MKMSKQPILLALNLVILLSGCATQTPYDYSALQASKPKSIVIIPPVNNTIEVNAAYAYLSTLSKPLAEKGYYVFPVAVVDQYFKDNGLPDTHEMNGIALDKLYEQFGADAVLYATINDWGQKFQLLSSNTVVDVQLKLVDARTGKLLWEAQPKRVQSSSDGNGGLTELIIAAAIQQVLNTVSDRTPSVARAANKNALNHQSKGLLKGPYKIEPQ